MASSSSSFNKPATGDTQRPAVHSHLSKSTIASFRHQNINMESVVRIIAQLDNIKALDLSYNKLTTLPKLLPPKMIAIDLSYNPIRGLQGFVDVANIVELKLNYNKIESCLGLAAAINLEYLEISHNRIAQIEGLENCSNLRFVNLCGNAIATTLHIRPLSLNLLLGEIDLRGNVITEMKQYKIAVMGFLTSLTKLDGASVRSAGSKAIKSYSQKFDDRLKGIIKHDPSLRYLAEGAIYTSGYFNGNGEYNSHYTNDSDDDEEARLDFDESTSQLPWRRPPNPVPNPLKFERRKRQSASSRSSASSDLAAHHSHVHGRVHHDGSPPSQHHHKHPDEHSPHLLHNQAESAAGKYYTQHRREQSSSSKHRQQLQSRLPGSPRKESKWSSPELNKRGSAKVSRAELILGPPLPSPPPSHRTSGSNNISYTPSRSNFENESSAFANISANLNLSAASSALLLPPPLPAEMGSSQRGDISFEKSSLDRLWGDEGLDAFSADDRLHEYSDIYCYDEEERAPPPQEQRKQSVYGSLKLLHQAINGPPSPPSYNVRNVRTHQQPASPTAPPAPAPMRAAPAPMRAAPAPMRAAPAPAVRAAPAVTRPSEHSADTISSADIKQALLDLMRRKQSSLASLQAKMRE